MYRSQSFLFVLLIFTAIVTTFAAPAPAEKSKKFTGSFKVPRVRQHNYVPDGAFALRKAKKKFGIGTLDTIPGTDFTPTISTNNKASNLTSGEGDGPSAPQNDAQFLSPVTVGGQEMILNFDTGSADTYDLLFPFVRANRGMLTCEKLAGYLTLGCLHQVDGSTRCTTRTIHRQ